MKKVLVILYMLVVAASLHVTTVSASTIPSYPKAETSSSLFENLLDALFSNKSNFTASASKYAGKAIHTKTGSKTTRSNVSTPQMPVIAFTSTSSLAVPSGSLASSQLFHHQASGTSLSIATKYKTRPITNSSTNALLSIAERDKRTYRHGSGATLAAGSFSAASTQPAIDATGTAVLAVGITPMAKGLGGGGVPIIDPEEDDEFLGPDPLGDALFPLLFAALFYAFVLFRKKKAMNC